MIGLILEHGVFQLKLPSGGAVHRIGAEEAPWLDIEDTALCDGDAAGVVASALLLLSEYNAQADGVGIGNGLCLHGLCLRQPAQHENDESKYDCSGYYDSL
jgi:hypothetical protein